MPVLQEIEITSCWGGRSDSCCPSSVHDALKGVRVILDCLLIRAHCGTFFRWDCLVALPEDSEADRHQKSETLRLRLKDMIPAQQVFGPDQGPFRQDQSPAIGREYHIKHSPRKMRDIRNY